MMRVDGYNLSFEIPKNGKAYQELEIPYELSGTGEGKIALIATALEKNIQENYYDSYVPGDMSAEIIYHGSVRKKIPETHEIGIFRKKGFISTEFEQHKISVKNTGDTIWKAQGLGAVSTKIQIFNDKDELIEVGVEFMQMLDKDFYPNESKDFYFMQSPLAEGIYKFRFCMFCTTDEGSWIFDPGVDFSYLEVPLEITCNEEKLSLNNPEFDKTSEKLVKNDIRRFPTIVTDFKEFLYTSIVFDKIEQTEKGVLKLLLPPWNSTVALKLITESGILTHRTSVEVDIKNLHISKESLQKTWSIKEDNDLKPVLATIYYPYRAARFAINPEKKIEEDMLDMKKNGVNVIWLQLLPHFIKYDNFPTLTALKVAREIGMKVIPSLYFWNQGVQLTEQTGIPLENGGDGFAAQFVDPLDNNLSVAFLKWFDLLIEEWGDVFYINQNGKSPILLGDEVALGVWTRRGAGFSLRDMEAFKKWALEKYLELDVINKMWGTSYTDVSEINPDLNYTAPKDYPAHWEIGSVALRDIDTFRSEILTKQFAQISRTIKAKYPNVLTGDHLFPVYGLEKAGLENYYSLKETNWVAETTATLEEHILNKEFSDLDFICNTYTSGDVDWGIVTKNAVDREIIPIVLPEFNSTKFVKDKGTHDYWKDLGGWYELQGVEGRDMRVLYPILPNIIDTYINGGVGGFYCWNDHPLFCIVTETQRKELNVLKNLLN